MKNKNYPIALLLISIIFVLHSIYLSVTAEDAFIGFHYAQNLATGDGLVWNAGETPVEGYTNLLWILFCSSAMLAGLDVIIFSKVGGLICGILILIYSYLFSRKILQISYPGSMIAPLFLAVSGPLAVWCSSGMETGLFSLLVLIAVYYTTLYLIKPRLRDLALSLFICFLATLTRPEGFGIFILLTIFIIISSIFRKGKKYTSRIVKASLIFYIVPFLIYFFWRLNYYGEILPLTYYAKTGGGIDQWIRGLKYVFFFIFHFILPLMPVIILYLWQRSERLNIKPDVKKYRFSFEKTETTGITLLLFLASIYTIYLIIIGGDYMAMYRFIVPVLPMMYILLAAAYIQIVKNQIEAFKKTILATIITISLIFTFIQSTPLEKFLFEKPGITHGQYRGVLTEEWNSNRLTLIGKFFNDHKKNEEESLATDAIGAISFYSHMKIYGMHGLDDPVIAKMKIKDLGKGFPGHEKSNIKYLLSKKPTYLMFTRELSESEVELPIYPFDVDSILHNDYDKVSVWLNDKENNESGYFTFLQRKTSQGN